MTNILSKNGSGFPMERGSEVKTHNKGHDLRVSEQDGEARKQALKKMAKRDVAVDIPDSVKDFSRIKRAVDRTPAKDNSDKIARLKEEIENGIYSIDYDALADKMLKSGL